MSDAHPHGATPPPPAATAAVDDEPRTPMWFTALGVALFVAVAVAWAACPSLR